MRQKWSKNCVKNIFGLKYSELQTEIVQRIYKGKQLNFSETVKNRFKISVSLTISKNRMMNSKKKPRVISHKKKMKFKSKCTLSGHVFLMVFKAFQTKIGSPKKALVLIEI